MNPQDLQQMWDSIEYNPKTDSFESHYTPTGLSETDLACVGFYF